MKLITRVRDWRVSRGQEKCLLIVKIKKILQVFLLFIKVCCFAIKTTTNKFLKQWIKEIFRWIS